MRILIIGQFYDEGFATFIAEALEAVGHQTVRHDPGPRLLPQNNRLMIYANSLLRAGYDFSMARRRSLRPNSTDRRLREALERAGRVDLVICTYDFLLPSDTMLVKEVTKSPLVLWYPDAILNFGRQMFLNGAFDFLFFKDPYISHSLKQTLGEGRFFYLPECYSPKSLSPNMVSGKPDSRFDADISTAGNLYSYRVELFKRLTKYDVKIWGNPAPRWMELGNVSRMTQNAFVAHAEKVSAFRGAKIVLNNLHPAEIWGINARAFEACGAGAFQLIDWRPALPELFDVGREIVAFDDYDDLERLVDRYLAEPEERRGIAEAGHARARRDHTYETRVRQLIETVEGRSSGFPEPVSQWERARVRI